MATKGQPPFPENVREFADYVAVATNGAVKYEYSYSPMGTGTDRRHVFSGNHEVTLNERQAMRYLASVLMSHSQKG